MALLSAPCLVGQSSLRSMCADPSTVSFRWDLGWGFVGGGDRNQNSADVSTVDCETGSAIPFGTVPNQIRSTSTGEWLFARATGGGVTIIVGNQMNLPIGTHSGSVELSFLPPNPLGYSPVTIEVTFTIDDPQFIVSPVSFSFIHQIGDSPPRRTRRCGVVGTYPDSLLVLCPSHSFIKSVTLLLHPGPYPSPAVVSLYFIQQMCRSIRVGGCRWVYRVYLRAWSGLGELPREAWMS